jgi:hypothetical protein
VCLTPPFLPESLRGVDLATENVDEIAKLIHASVVVGGTKSLHCGALSQTVCQPAGGRFY